jgi:hypothetical protein
MTGSVLHVLYALHGKISIRPRAAQRDCHEAHESMKERSTPNISYP